MKEVSKHALDHIIVKSNARMKQIIDWYIANQDYLESQPFVMPFKQGLVCLEEEDIDFSFETISDSNVLIKIYPGRKNVHLLAFNYDPIKDVIRKKDWASKSNIQLTELLKTIEAIDKTSKKEAFKYRVLMYFAAYYKNEIVVDKSAEIKLDKRTRKALKRKNTGPIPLVRNTYILEPSDESLKKPAKPVNQENKRHYEKPDHEVKVRGYRRKNGTWVEPYSRYKDKNDGEPKMYKA